MSHSSHTAAQAARQAAQAEAAPKQLLLVIAHPDDESMFFAPTINHWKLQGAQIHVLCLSNGNGAGLGRVREKELIKACNVLEIPVANVTVVDDPQLQDGMRIAWVADVVASHVERHLKLHPCDSVVTFDEGGVSRHINHRGVAEGVRQLLRGRGAALGVKQAWQLVSECLAIKYSGLLALPLLALMRRPGQRLLLGGRVLCSIRAMAAHHSQWVWYRKLFVLLSSYTFANRLAPLPLG